MKDAEIYDAIVIGGGPAGLTAALFLSRAKYRTLVIQRDAQGGQIAITDEIVNYPGVLTASGRQLTETMREQALNFGAEFLLANVTSIEANGDIKRVHTDRGDYKSFGLLIATGANPRTVGFDGESKFKGHGVAYCATCDGEFFTDKDIFVVGGGFAAAEESVFLTKYARSVTILVRGNDFTCAKATADAAKNHPKIKVLTNTDITGVSGDEHGITRVTCNINGKAKVFEAKQGENYGVFVFIGYSPSTDIVKDIVELDPSGYIITDRNQKTNVLGVYAAGDVCVKNLRQVATAIGDGAIAATELEKHAAAMQKQTGIIPTPPQSKREKREVTEQTAQAESSTDSIFDENTVSQLVSVFSKCENPLTLKIYLDNSDKSHELEAYVTELQKLSDKISIEKVTDENKRMPCVEVYKNGKYTGLAFHGVPGGHEFTSFVLGLYNASGPGQSITDADAKRIAALKPTDIKLFVSLSCTMCPETVVAAQHIAALNSGITAEAYDIALYPDIKEEYKIMSVPCILIDGKRQVFGKKNLTQLLDELAQ